MIVSLALLYAVICTDVTKSEACSEEVQCANCDQDGVCETDCYTGYYGNRCTLPCSPTCLNRKCKLLKDRGIENCTDGCILGYKGTRCMEVIPPCHNPENVCSKCPTDCDGQLCRMTNHCAKGCKDSYYGTDCKSCSPNCELCGRVSGTCRQCKPNWGGSECQYPCANCLGECDKIGCSDDCKRGYYGPFCTNRCSDNCKDISGTTIQSENNTCGGNGICVHGCKDGWYGSTCSIKCGDECKKGKCSEDGSCEEGCMSGYYGSNCNPCPPHCRGGQCEASNGLCSDCTIGFFGRLCNETCGGCISDRCNQATGTCIYGCKPSYHGELCDTYCASTSECTIPKETDVQAKTRSDSGTINNKMFFGIGLALIILLCVISGLLMAHLCRRRRQKHERKNDDDETREAKSEPKPCTTSTLPYHTYCEIVDGDSRTVINERYTKPFGTTDTEVGRPPNFLTEECLAESSGNAYRMQYLTPKSLE